MKQSEKNEKIYEMLAKMSILFDNPPTEKRLIAYVSFLNRFSMHKLEAAIEKACTSCFKFPTLADLFKIIQGENDFHDVAVQLSGKVIDSISRYGKSAYNDARKNVGEIAWQGVEAVGGWSVVSSVNTKDLPNIRAQLRDAIKAVLKSSIASDRLALDKVQI